MDGLPWLRILFVSYLVWVILAVLGLLIGRRSPTATLAWIFAFMAFPVVSGLYYMVFGPRRMHRRRRRYGVARSLAGQVSEHLRNSCAPYRPHLAADASRLAAVGRRLGQGGPTLAAAAHLFDHGDEMLEALAEAIANARHHAHLEYYIWEPDAVGTRFRDALVAAAKRGAEVRVLTDAVGSSALKEAFWRPLLEAGGETRVFNPVRLSVASLNFANFRTHRKIAVIDGTVAFLGGVNLHDPASARRSGREAWRDEHVRIDGEPVRKIQRLFLENWTYAGGNFRMTPRSVPAYFPPASPCEPGISVQILASGPDDENAPLLTFLLAALATARSRVWIETPYLVPDETLESALRVAHLRGVDVQLIVPKEGDSRLVMAASNTYCQSLAKAGIVVFEYGPSMLHAKTVVVDETVALVGTANLDNRSFRLNFEIAAALYDARLIASLAARFERDRATSQPFPLRKRNPRFTVLLESLARLASPVL
ncbi:MAG TPA: cardiolipin synthase [Usitatibacter sp.]|nr:cardiolipin synthase [Usitatibacter sp.]